MRALLPTPDSSATVAFGEVVEPRPAAAELVIEVAAFSLNRGETFLLERPPRPGWRPGKDVAGTVVAAAADGSGPALGERVVAHAAEAGWAERVAVPADRVAPLPDSVDFTRAAALPLAGLTALRLGRAAGDLASRRVLLTGASGGVGHYFVELAAARGALVTAVASSPERGERLRRLGAAAVVASVAAAEGPFAVGGDSTAAVLHRLDEDGRLVWFGQASGEPPRLDFFDWAGGANATIRKFHYEGDPAASDAEDLATLVRLVAGGRLHPELGLVADWGGTNDAIAALLDRRLRGNAVLTISSPTDSETHHEGS
jgi:NADPH:quinone reductase